MINFKQFQKCLSEDDPYLCLEKLPVNFKEETTRVADQEINQTIPKDPKKITEEIIQKWLYQVSRRFGNPIGMNSNGFNSNPKLRMREIEDLQTSLDRQKKLLTPKSQESQKLASLIELLMAGIRFYIQAEQTFSSGKGEQSFGKEWLEVDKQIYLDGKIDNNEKLLLDLLTNIGQNENFISLGSDPLHFIKDGYRVSLNPYQPISFKTSVDKPFLLYPNLGEVDEGEEVKHPPSSLDHYKSRNQEEECYSFALSNSFLWKLGDFVEPGDMLERGYRQVNLSQERAKKDDVIAYFSYFIPDYRHDRPDEKIGGPFQTVPPEFNQAGSSIPHMGLVSQVDAKGWPTKVISKFGQGGEVYEHLTHRAPFAYGQFWGVFRKR